MRYLKTISSALVIVVLLLFVQCTSKNEKLHHQLTEMAASLNKLTPVVIDPHTRFDSVAVTKDVVFQYYYTIVDIDNPKELLRAQKNGIIENMENAFATDKTLRVFKENKVTIEYIYRDTTKRVVDIITITPDLYK